MKYWWNLVSSPEHSLQLCAWLTAAFPGEGEPPLSSDLGPHSCSQDLCSEPTILNLKCKTISTPCLICIWIPCRIFGARIVAASWFSMDLNGEKKTLFSHLTKNMWNRISLYLVKFYFKKLRPWSNHNEVSGTLSTDSVGLGYGPKTLFSEMRTVRNVSNIRNLLFIVFL